MLSSRQWPPIYPIDKRPHCSFRFSRCAVYKRHFPPLRDTKRTAVFSWAVLLKGPPVRAVPVAFIPTSGDLSRSVETSRADIQNWKRSPAVGAKLLVKRKPLASPLLTFEYMKPA
jgi:hypothetical protein